MTVKRVSPIAVLGCPELRIIPLNPCIRCEKVLPRMMMVI